MKQGVPMRFLLSDAVLRDGKMGFSVAANITNKFKSMMVETGMKAAT